MLFKVFLCRSKCIFKFSSPQVPGLWLVQCIGNGYRVFHSCINCLNFIQVNQEIFTVWLPCLLRSLHNMQLNSPGMLPTLQKLPVICCLQRLDGHRCKPQAITYKHSASEKQLLNVQVMPISLTKQLYYSLNTYITNQPHCLLPYSSTSVTSKLSWSYKKD